MSKCVRRRRLCRVSSAAIKATSRSVRTALGDKSSRFPIGVATTKRVPKIVVLVLREPRPGTGNAVDYTPVRTQGISIKNPKRALFHVPRGETA
jgi:hypothetical protein